MEKIINRSSFVSRYTQVRKLEYRIMKNIGFVATLLLTPLHLYIIFNTGTVHAAVFTFDDLPLSNPLITMGTGTGSSVMLTEYNGFQFTSDNSFERVDAVNFNILSTAAGPAYSGPYALTNNVFGNILITDIDGDAFSFESLFIKNWIPGTTPETHSIRGFLGGTEVASVPFGIMDTWQQVVGNFSNIDTLMIDVTKASGETDLFMMDDLVLGPVIPIPAAVWLFGSGLIGLIGIARQKKA